MKVVYESIENGLAKFIPDNGESPIYVSENILPQTAVLGDIFYCETKEESCILTLLPNERSTRLARIKAKREQLLKASIDETE